MAKNAKTPPPRVQAPRTRTGGHDPRRVRMIAYAVAAAGVLGLAAVLAAVFASGGRSGGGSSNVATLMKAAGCDFKTVDAFVPKGQGTHVNSLVAKLKWNTFPPSNGQHYPAWAVWGFYSEPVNPRQVVHNEEHGGIVLWWGPKTPKATVEQLRELYNEDPSGMFGTPIAGLGSKIAVTAWTGDSSRYTRDGYFGQGHVGTCARYDAKTKQAFEAFRDAYRDRGPEGFPSSQNQPGMGPG